MIKEELKGALLMLLTEKVKLDEVGMEEMVRNCCPNELEREQVKEVLK